MARNSCTQPLVYSVDIPPSTVTTSVFRDLQSAPDLENAPIKSFVPIIGMIGPKTRLEEGGETQRGEEELSQVYCELNGGHFVPICEIYVSTICAQKCQYCLSCLRCCLSQTPSPSCPSCHHPFSPPP